jgi:hypothetical protein
LHYLEAEHAKGEVVTGLNFIDEDLPGMHAISKTELAPLARHPLADLSPGAAALAKLQIATNVRSGMGRRM